MMATWNREQLDVGRRELQPAVVTGNGSSALRIARNSAASVARWTRVASACMLLAAGTLRGQSNSPGPAPTVSNNPGNTTVRRTPTRPTSGKPFESTPPPSEPERPTVSVEIAPPPPPAVEEAAPAESAKPAMQSERNATTEPATPEEKPAPEAEPAKPEAALAPIGSWLDAQVELARRGFSSGAIDGAVGPKTRAALRAWQISQKLVPSAELDEATHERLMLTAPAIKQASLSAAELGALQPLSKTWLGKSQQTALAHETALEAIAEKYHAHPNFIKKLNPSVDWDAVTEDTPFNVPAVDRVTIPRRAVRAEIRLAEFVFQAFDASGRVIAHLPVSIGRLAESRPVGELHVTVVVPDPNYTFDPAVFPESAEARELGRKLILQPGPNNPVGVAWIGLDRPGYGIHGTPAPERIGSAESHGCFRMANWDARTLLKIAWTGLPVEVLSGDAGN